ncbi:hypothetical protein BC940DRAFT_306172 [Gongronella butleri]|nr:hypothetical protein BC940DRAFT_306172 [Gongronella butleri]
MSSINEQLYERVREKGKEQHLTEQELKAIDTAKQQINTHTQFGGLGGASAAFLLGRAKKLAPFPLFAVAAGGFLMGSQVGFVAGALASVNTIKTLPNPERVVNVIRQVQEETRRQQPGQASGPAPSQRTTMPISDTGSVPSQHHTEDELFVTDDASVHGGHANTSGTEFQTDRASELQQKRGWAAQVSGDALKGKQQSAPSSGAWDKIRSANVPNSAWTRIRQDAAQHPTDHKSIEESKAKRIAQLQEQQASFDDLPRTREEAEQRVKMQRNQWGDPVG